MERRKVSRRNTRFAAHFKREYFPVLLNPFPPPSFARVVGFESTTETSHLPRNIWSLIRLVLGASSQTWFVPKFYIRLATDKRQIACRCERPLAADTISKIARSCHREIEQVIAVRDMQTVYQVPLLLEQQGLVNLLKGALRLDKMMISPALVDKGAELWKLWNKTVLPKQHLELVNIAIVGKYVETHDAYLSVVKALEHSAMRCNKALNIIWIDSEHLEDSTQDNDPAKYHQAWMLLHTVSGVVIPGGFGERGVEGMIKAASWTRTKRVPMLGICLGMQVAVIEAARNLCGDKNTASEEFEGHSEDSVVIFMPEGSRTEKGGTMRLVCNPRRVSKSYLLTNIISGVTTNALPTWQRTEQATGIVWVCRCRRRAPPTSL
jgi:CTP synthase (UTP-ammonia lyase)